MHSYEIQLFKGGKWEFDSDLAPFIPPFMSRICSGYGPDWTGL
jgi:hypothetical protein